MYEKRIEITQRYVYTVQNVVKIHSSTRSPKLLDCGAPELQRSCDAVFLIIALAIADVKRQKHAT